MPSYSLFNTKNKKPQTQLNTAQSLAQQVASKQIKPPVPVTNMSQQTLGTPAGGPLPTNTGPLQERKAFEPGAPGNNAPPAGFDKAASGVVAGATSFQDRMKNQNEAATEAAAADKALKIAEAKRVAKSKMEEAAKVNTQEEAEGIDINGDGLIGYDQKLGGGRPMTEEEIINTQLRKLLQGGATPEETEKERQAMKGELAASEARDIQSTRARTGLGGMGLTGAAGAMESQVRQEGARKQALTMADFERQQRSESAQRALEGIQARRGEQVFRTETKQYEEEEGKDNDGDGLIGDTPIAEWEASSKQKEKYNSYYAEAQANTAIATRTGSTVTVSGDEGNTYQNGSYTKAEGNSYRNVPAPYEDKGFVMVGDKVVHLFKGKDGKLYYTEPKKPE